MNAELSRTDATPEWLTVVRDQVEHLRFGVVQIVVHEHRVVQVERTEKVRFDQSEKQRENLEVILPTRHRAA